MRVFTLILLLCVATFSQAQEADTQSQLTEMIFNDPTSPRQGAEKLALVIVNFTDYNCPYCKQFDPMLEKIVHDYPQVQLVVKLLPFRGESSMTSARVALTTWRQQPEKFWALHQRLMAKKGTHDDASILSAQQKTQTADIKADAQSTDSVKLNLILSQVLGIQGTPATIVGDQMVAGAIAYDDLEALVKEQLAKTNAQ
ncbi:DSBA oxidoreductase [Pseudocitrobacter faecalis]|uniref:DsbA family protein n=1 Tax=Pseudocitrobacter faecalis TaxID=1398493 RepID=UPI00167B8D27|nr:DsbA family protein [Pseudocitrobacter faecalis]GHD96104.1 DSBA oxidoreductase [Pseudocitrobacter faecalis]